MSMDRLSARGDGPVRRTVGLLLALLAASVLISCAPVQQGRLKGAFDGAPTLKVGPDGANGWFTSFDGAKLGLTRWEPAASLGDADPPPVIVALHGMNMYAGAYNDAGKWWAAHGAIVYAYDQRGFGRSPKSGIWPDPELLRQDLRTAVATARRLHPGSRIAVVGESMGAAVAITAFASDTPPDADELVLVGPGLYGWGALPWFYSASLWTSAHVRPSWIVVPPKGVHITPTDNRDKLIENWNDPYVQKENRIDSVYGVVSIMEEADQKIAKLPARVKTLLLYGAKDEVIPEYGVRRATAKMPPHVKTAYYAKGYHMLINDRQAETVWRDVLGFIENPESPVVSGAPPLPWLPRAGDGP
jgi:acylglycerol lipase